MDEIRFGGNDDPLESVARNLVAKYYLVELLLKSTIVPVGRPYDDWVPGCSLKEDHVLD